MVIVIMFVFISWNLGQFWTQWKIWKHKKFKLKSKYLQNFGCGEVKRIINLSSYLLSKPLVTMFHPNGGPSSIEITHHKWCQYITKKQCDWLSNYALRCVCKWAIVFGNGQVRLDHTHTLRRKKKGKKSGWIEYNTYNIKFPHRFKYFLEWFKF